MKRYGIGADEMKKRMCRDIVALEREEYRERADSHFLTYGPKTGHEFPNLRARGGG